MKISKELIQYAIVRKKIEQDLSHSLLCAKLNKDFDLSIDFIRAAKGKISDYEAYVGKEGVHKYGPFVGILCEKTNAALDEVNRLKESSDIHRHLGEYT
jgi:hypothetical protein